MTYTGTSPTPREALIDAQVRDVTGSSEFLIQIAKQMAAMAKKGAEK